MFFAGITYNIIAIAMAICLFIGSFAFEGSIEQLCKIFWGHQEISIELSEYGENQITEHEEKSVEKAVAEEKSKRLYTFSPPVHPIIYHYSYSRYNYSATGHFLLRAPPYYSITV